jgi:capsular polysaccharide transport system permease protein
MISSKAPDDWTTIATEHHQRELRFSGSVLPFWRVGDIAGLASWLDPGRAGHRIGMDGQAIRLGLEPRMAAHRNVGSDNFFDRMFNNQLFSAKSTTRMTQMGSTMKYLAPLGKNIWFSVFVILPTVLAALYYGLIASDQYVSESQFTVKSQNRQAPQVSSLASLFAASGLSSGQEQANEVVSYIESRNGLQDLQRNIDVRAIYANPLADMLSRYPAPWRSNHFESLYRYYRGMVDAHLDNESGLAVLSVRAYTAADAHRINLLLLNSSEALVNRLNEKAQANAIAEAERRVTRAEARVRDARLALSSYRNREGLLDPNKQAAGVLDVSNRLVAERSELQSQLNDMKRHAPQNPSIAALQGRIVAIGHEIDAQNGRAVGTTTGIASKLGSYEKLALEQEFAAQTLTAANASLEQARSDAQRQQFYLERVVEPDTPDLALLPHRLLKILTVAATALCLYFIGWMLVVGILEHSPED